MLITKKGGRSKFVDARVHNSLWNAPNILAKYRREHRAGDDAFNDVVLKADIFVAQMRPFAKSKNRRGSIGWWSSDQGRREDHARMAHLIAIPPTALVFQCDDIVKRGRYATIRKVRIEGAPGIEQHWELAAKLSNNWQRRPDLAKIEHQNESMAVTIPHPDVIRFGGHSPQQVRRLCPIGGMGVPCKRCSTVIANLATNQSYVSITEITQMMRSIKFID